MANRFEVSVTAYGKGLTKEKLDKAEAIINELKLLLLVDDVTVNSRVNIDYPEAKSESK